MLRWWETFAGAVSSVIFPSGCRLCDGLLMNASRLPICDRCLSSFEKMPAECCDTCGQPFSAADDGETELSLCENCREQKFNFAMARSYGRYEGELARAILLLKFERLEPLGNWFAERLRKMVQAEAARMRADVIVPVPLHRQRQRERGFNQVELFAKPLAKKLGIPYRPVLLMRQRARPEKHLLSTEERWEAVRGAFAIRKRGRVDNLRILLLDDVMTSGATLDACSRALREAGAKSVAGLTIARAVRQGIPVRESF